MAQRRLTASLFADADSRAAINDLMRVTTEDGRVRSIRWYYFSPDFLTEVAAALDEPVELNGHHY